MPTSLREAASQRLQARRDRSGRLQVATWPLWVEPLGDHGPPERELRIGFDTGARLLETVVLVFESGDELIIHAMAARRKYWDLLP